MIYLFLYIIILHIKYNFLYGKYQEVIYKNFIYYLEIEKISILSKTLILLMCYDNCSKLMRKNDEK